MARRCSLDCQPVQQHWLEGQRTQERLQLSPEYGREGLVLLGVGRVSRHSPPSSPARGHCRPDSGVEARGLANRGSQTSMRRTSLGRGMLEKRYAVVVGWARSDVSANETQGRYFPDNPRWSAPRKWRAPQVISGVLIVPRLSCAPRRASPSMCFTAQSHPPQQRRNGLLNPTLRNSWHNEAPEDGHT